MTLADDANEKPVMLAMPASLPEWMRMSTMSRTLSIRKMAVSTAFSTGLLLLGADVVAGVYRHTIVAPRPPMDNRGTAGACHREGFRRPAPVISAGWARPSRASAVGARSHSRQPQYRAQHE